MTDNLPAIPPIAGFHLWDENHDVVAVLPVPSELAAMIIGHVENDVTGLRRGIEQRGGVLAAADMFEIHRHLQGAADLIGDYGRKFKDIAKHVKDMQEEALTDAVGADAQGQPLNSLTVPDQGGDIRITRKSKNTHTITPEQILPAFASMFADQHVDAVMGACVSAADDDKVRATVGVAIAEAIVDALNSVGELGKFEPQVSKVRAYAEALARAGHDNASAIVSKAIHTSRDYDGISVERKTT